MDEVVGGSIPREFIPSCDKGFRSMIAKGFSSVCRLAFRVVLNDGQNHQVDSSDMAFQQAAQGAWREFYLRAKPISLEPVMKVELEAPQEFQWRDHRTDPQRRGSVIGATEDDGFARVESQVPLGDVWFRRRSARLRKERRSSRWSSPATSAARRAF